MREYNNKLICFLDVLGYSQMIEDKGIDNIYEQYYKFIEKAKTKAFYGKTTHKNQKKDTFLISDIVSDSMLFVSNDINDEFSVNNFIGAIHYILELGLEHNFLFRGAITIGNMIYDIDNSIFLSEEYNKLAKFEPTMELPMCVIFEEAKKVVTESLYGVKLMKNGITPSGDLPIIKYKIPLKQYEHVENDTYLKKYIHKEMWCINYTFFSNKKTLEQVKKFLSGDVKKQTNFIKYIEFVKTIPYQIIEVEKKLLPLKYLQIMKSRTGLRVSFLDEQMSVCQASEHIPFPTAFISQPDNINIGYNPDTKEFSFQASGRWKE
jgi:hypothetical protein